MGSAVGATASQVGTTFREIVCSEDAVNRPFGIALQAYGLAKARFLLHNPEALGAARVILSHWNVRSWPLISDQARCVLVTPMPVPHRNLPKQPSDLSEIVLARVRLNRIRGLECVQHVLDSLSVGRGGWIATANLDHLRRLQQPGEFRRVYDSASIVLADGMPLVWASHLQGTPLPERVAGSDLIYSLTAGAAETGFSVFLLGGDEGTARAASECLIARYPGLRVAGTYCPPLGFEKDPHQMAELRRIVAESRADIVYVALGSPKQELLIDKIRDVLPGAWWVGVGISFSFVCGEVKRAPRWIQRIGLEWLHRLAQEPRRLGGRYLWHGPPFLIRLLAGALQGRGKAARRAPQLGP